MAFDASGYYTWVFTPGGTGGGTWSYLSRAALPSAVGSQTGNTSCGKYIWTTDGWIFNPKGASTSKYVNGRTYYILGPDGRTHSFGSSPPPITYDPKTRTFGQAGSTPEQYNNPSGIDYGQFVILDNGTIYWKGQGLPGGW